MTERDSGELIQSCIDFRTAEEVEYRQQKVKSYLIAHAGGSFDTAVAVKTIKNHSGYFSRFVNLDHKECGVFTKVASDDSDLNHQKHMDILRNQIRALDPNIEFSSHILQINQERYAHTHTCVATAIILGDPDILQAAIERLRQDGTMGRHDLIAMPFSLEDHDTLLTDLKLSLDLHRPKPHDNNFKIYIFDRDSDNAMILMEKVRKIAEGAEVEPIIVLEASKQENVA